MGDSITYEVPERFCRSQSEIIDPDEDKYFCPHFSNGEPFHCPIKITDIKSDVSRGPYCDRCPDFQPVEGLLARLNSDHTHANATH